MIEYSKVGDAVRLHPPDLSHDISGQVDTTTATSLSSVANAVEITQYTSLIWTRAVQLHGTADTPSAETRSYYTEMLTAEKFHIGDEEVDIHDVYEANWSDLQPCDAAVVAEGVDKVQTSSAEQNFDVEGNGAQQCKRIKRWADVEDSLDEELIEIVPKHARDGKAAEMYPSIAKSMPSGVLIEDCAGRAENVLPMRHERISRVTSVGPGLDSQVREQALRMHRERKKGRDESPTHAPKKKRLRRKKK